MEVVGVFLGVLPLIVSVIEHYDFFAPFICHCAFTRELQSFRRKLEARKLLFRNECRLLLEALVEEELIGDMFREGSQHPSWKDKDLDERVQKHLGQSYTACIGMISAIKECLAQLKQKTRGLGTVLEPKTGLAFGKKSLDNDLDALKDMNEDLKELSRQIRELKDGHEKRVQLCATRQAITRRSDLSGFQTVRKASENLYRALSRASTCLAHKEHSATLCIDARSFQESQSPRVKFNMAFGASIGGPVWINIESTITSNSAEGIIKVVQDSRPLVTCLKRQGDFAATEVAVSKKTTKASRSRHILDSGSPTKTDEHQSDAVSLHSEYSDGDLSRSNSNDVPDLSVQNFCFHIQQNTSALYRTDVCTGFLREGFCNHLLYLTPKSSCTKKEPQNLAHIISSVSDKWPLSRYPRAQRIRLAKVLAKAVLEYHDTPWLLDSWRSQDIQFFAEPSQLLAALDVPHLTVRFPGERKTLTSSHDQPIAQNNTLFGLVTILLELDFEKPLSHMRLPGDVVDNSPQDTEFKTAARLAKSTHPGLGPGFRKIIRKCLHCNFGIDDTNLTRSEELKSKVHEEVICGLEDLERTLAGCSLVDVRGVTDC
ncbi:hypothetical protein MMC13_005096 [Lambiella insularis]|nr:hypothetical protein [Lambiella insularis]